MGTILFIRIFLVSDGSDTSGVPFSIPMQKDSRNFKPLATHQPGRGARAPQPGSGLSAASPNAAADLFFLLVSEL